MPKVRHKVENISREYYGVRASEREDLFTRLSQHRKLVKKYNKELRT